MRIIWSALFIASLFIVWFFLKLPGYAHMPDRPDLDQWFSGLSAAKGGNCCSFADGLRLEDVDWEVKDGHYRVRVWGEWVDVPDSALVTTANKFGPAVVWPWRDSVNHINIRCFMPGAGT